MGKVLLRALLLVIIVLQGCASFASVVESQEWLVGSRTHRTLDRLTEYFGFPNPEMAKDEAVVFVRIEGASYAIYVVGPVAGKAKAYAEALDRWRALEGKSGQVEFSQENDCAAARFLHSQAKWGATKVSTSINLESLRATLANVEPKTSVGLIVTKLSTWSMTTPSGLQSSNGVRYWNLGAIQGPLPIATSSLEVPAYLSSAAILWLLWLPISAGIIALGCSFVRPHPDRPIRDQRKRFTQIALGGTFVSIGIHAAASLYVIPTRVFDPVAVAWTGSSFASVGIAVISVGLIACLGMFWMVSKFEQRIFGPTPEEKAEAIQLAGEQEEFLERYPAAPSAPVRQKRLEHLFVGVGFTLLITSYFLSKQLSAIETLLALLGMTLTIMGRHIAEFLIPAPKLENWSENLLQWQETLDSEIALLNEEWSMSAKGVVLSPGVAGRMKVIGRFPNEVQVTADVLESMERNELRFLVAHEMHRLRKGRPRILALQIWIPIATSIPIFIIFLRADASALRTIMPLLLIPMALILILALVSRSSARQLQQECDIVAAKAVLDPGVGIRALTKISYADQAAGESLVDPQLLRRLEALRKAGT